MLRYLKKILLSKIFFYVFLTAAIFVIFISTNHGKRFINFFNSIFAVKEVSFVGMNEVSIEELLKESGIIYKTNIFSYSTDEIKRKIEKISLVKSAIVQRKLPCIYKIKIIERIPIAYWQNKDKLYLVDSDGKIFSTSLIKSLPALPIAIGENANKYISPFFSTLEKYSNIKNQVIFCIFLGNRRWDIRISGGLLIKLPEDGLSNALDILMKMSNNTGNFDKNISAIDLRIPGRVVITKKNEKKKTKTEFNEI